MLNCQVKKEKADIYTSTCSHDSSSTSPQPCIHTLIIWFWSCIRVGRKTIWLTGWPAQLSLFSLEALLPVSRSTTVSMFCILIHGLQSSCENEQFKSHLHWLFPVLSLSSQEDQAHRCWMRKPQQVSRSSSHPGQLAEKKPPWLQGKVLNFPKASQPPLMMWASLRTSFCSALIFSHTSRNKHSHKDGKTSLGPGDSQSSRKITCKDLEWGHWGFITSAPRKANSENGAVVLSADDTETHRQATATKQLQKVCMKGRILGEYLNENMKEGWC